MKIPFVKQSGKSKEKNERGVAMAMAVIIVAILSVVALTALAFSSTEVRIAASDLQRSQAFYASISSMEKMTNDFSNLFRTKIRPTIGDLDTIKNSPPPALTSEGFDFTQTLEEDSDTLAKLRATQGITNGSYPRVNIPEGAFAGLYASIIPYKMSSTATNRNTKTQVELERNFNNYLVPMFQFGIFSNEDLEFSPGPVITFNGRIHSNSNVYALRNTSFLNRVTMAGELVRDATTGGLPNNQTGFDNVWINVGGKNVQINKGSVQANGSVVGGPNIVGSTSGTRGFYPGSPDGVPNPNWESKSVKTATGTPDQFGGQLLTQTTGATQLKIPLQLEGNSPAEIIKRTLPSDSEIMQASRYQNKAAVRILIDDETAGSGAANGAGIPAGKGVQLSNFTPSVLNGGTSTLRLISDSGTVSGTLVQQRTPIFGIIQPAQTVRGVRSSAQTVGLSYIPGGSGITGRILIEVVKPDGTSVDVTQQILSMGVTEGEPNGIVYLQRPLWAAATQGSRDRKGNGFDLVSLTRNSQYAADGEIKDPTPFFDASRNLISTTPATADDDLFGTVIRESAPSGYNIIVPINVYNVREGWVRSTMSENNVYYERGITSVVELNMRNLARWLDGVYDTNLLSGSPAVSTNIKGVEGYVVYVSDRRGDKIKTEYTSDGTAYNSTNGTVDNEDIYGPNNTLDTGEDVIDFGRDAGGNKKGTLQHDTSEIPDTGNFWTVNSSNRVTIGMSAMTYKTNFFRRSVRLFDGERLSVTGASGKLSPIKGITVATENMLYLWGNYNTTGVTTIPDDGSTLNDGSYTGPQIPASIVCDAIFPLSKTWFDSLSAMYPEGSSNSRNQLGEPYRMADENLTDVTQSTSVRAAIIAGTNLTAINAAPGRDAANSRKSGGVVNFPRFLELWNLNGTEMSWNYTGSFVPLYHSTQALSQWENTTSIIYMPPRRNWSFDQTFLNPNQLPPGTPFFQYVQATAFRQKLHD